MAFYLWPKFKPDIEWHKTGIRAKFYSGNDEKLLAKRAKRKTDLLSNGWCNWKTNRVRCRHRLFKFKRSGQWKCPYQRNSRYYRNESFGNCYTVKRDNEIAITNRGNRQSGFLWWLVPWWLKWQISIFICVTLSILDLLQSLITHHDVNKLWLYTPRIIIIKIKRDKKKMNPVVDRTTGHPRRQCRTLIIHN